MGFERTEEEGWGEGDGEDGERGGGGERERSGQRGGDRRAESSQALRQIS